MNDLRKCESRVDGQAVAAAGGAAPLAGRSGDRSLTLAAPSSRAFTLIELLVVVTIIVVLLALLTPALDKAITAAEIAVCGANLHGWGQGHSQYYFDNKRKILAVPFLRQGLGTGLLPNHPRWRRTSGVEAGDFNLDDIAPYVQGPNDGPWKNATYVGEIWYCPSSNDPFWYKNVADSQARNVPPGDPTSDYLSFMYVDYSYFGFMGSKYRKQATLPERLSSRTLGEGRILMSETIYRLASNPSRWWINHTEEGYSMHEPGFGGPTFSGVPPRLLGANQLYADGSVGWKDGREFDPGDLESRDRSIGWVSSAEDNGRPHDGGNINFY